MDVLQHQIDVLKAKQKFQGKRKAPTSKGPPPKKVFKRPMPPSAPKPIPAAFGTLRPQQIPMGTPFSQSSSLKNLLCYRCGKPSHMKAYCHTKINKISTKHITRLIEVACYKEDDMIPIGNDTHDDKYQAQEEDAQEQEYYEEEGQQYEYYQEETQDLIDFNNYKSQLEN